ncbi:protein of unknown function DUF1130 [Chthoniobacter flavus Ellin428]|uniref:Uncharacterized protein n=1 Tax=Chthoniobacter flavus Ellin428 TaxID=497964 RepID=B4CUN5_9BACT|nr:DUF488 domain-containing protein [Chthoniobacter flavus]EDY22273.1 protein of unknown function DUF1130 [Chthoniobacter flavus Ellin428]TCO94708.1 uncharacterized protein DUF488 [Chthoniobacter flavus]
MQKHEPRTIFTVGHSTRPIEEFIGLLQAHGVALLVDVRTVPRSRHNPQFERDALAKSLDEAGIEYRHVKDLGGLRKPKQESVNSGWRNQSFRGYADYMQTEDFTAAIEKLIEAAQTKQVAVMCAEAVPWRCHRSLIADALVIRGIPVEHIMSATRRDPHHLTPFAKRTGLRITYPPEAADKLIVES